jgi:hypothetical protein
VVEDARYAAESLLIARHMMFSQVYKHKTRTIFDYHLVESIKSILGKGQAYPSAATKESLLEYLKWDDWRIQSKIQSGEAGEHGRLLLDRCHYRLVFDFELISPTELDPRLQELESELAPFSVVRLPVAVKGFGGDIPVRMRTSSGSGFKPLSKISSVPEYLRGFNRIRFYAPMSSRDSAAKACSSLSASAPRNGS